MASLTDILATIQNGVVAVNNLTEELNGAWKPWTPSAILSSTGTVTVADFGSTYFKIGRLVAFRLNIGLTTSSTTNFIAVSLPVPRVGQTGGTFGGTSAGSQMAFGRENTLTGNVLQMVLDNGIVLNYDNSVPAINGATYAISGTYEASS